MHFDRHHPLHRYADPAKGLAFTALVTFCLIYLIFHALNGDNGVYALFKELRRKEVSTQQLFEVRAAREQLEHRVSLMGNDRLDLDLLEEEARKELGYARPDEVIYLWPDEPLPAKP